LSDVPLGRSGPHGQFENGTGTARTGVTSPYLKWLRVGELMVERMKDGSRRQVRVEFQDSSFKLEERARENLMDLVMMLAWLASLREKVRGFY
jgi:hypothetical protein